MFRPLEAGQLFITTLLQWIARSGILFLQIVRCAAFEDIGFRRVLLSRTLGSNGFCHRGLGRRGMASGFEIMMLRVVADRRIGREDDVGSQAGAERGAKAARWRGLGIAV
ncbi:hypothetical protein DU505_02750 [Billgrantia montanilacus]|uniref:Uncharacterized protein n=1 Tax=Billgrantia montanilacus TaxID=2282305 RepID=A0A368U419_9GAMM|nr:hypothetical protein DU505_02750 [Halomonas montanilacus]